eukprot:TRINITY_DN65185_c0_g1_i3.p2 TRINITY_DN65185_c0_g1~~TRINITY_DN65185_c0_g1_i3.p2  ORF type:complete len:148 (-),score=8.65 TRINITY_DN65185_c0_g1_i3:656-1099(-)
MKRSILREKSKTGAVTVDQLGDLRQKMDMFHRAMNGWKRGDLIGRGAHGSVYLALSHFGELLAVKQVDLGCLLTPEIPIPDYILTEVSKYVSILMMLCISRFITWRNCNGTNVSFPFMGQLLRARTICLWETIVVLTQGKRRSVVSS